MNISNNAVNKTPTNTCSHYRVKDCIWTSWSVKRNYNSKPFKLQHLLFKADKFNSQS